MARNAGYIRSEGMNKAFWVMVAVDAALFLFLFVATLVQPGPSDGGRDMALGFGVILPGIVIGLAILLYVFSSSTTWRAIALFVVAGPGLLIAGIHLRNAYLKLCDRAKRGGARLFFGPSAEGYGPGGGPPRCGVVTAICPES